MSPINMTLRGRVDFDDNLFLTPSSTDHTHSAVSNRDSGYLQFFGIIFFGSRAAARFQQPSAALGAHQFALYGFGLKENRPARAVRLR